MRLYNENDLLIESIMPKTRKTKRRMYYRANKSSPTAPASALWELNPGKLVVADGSEDVLLICPRTGEGRVKQIIEGAVSRKKGYA